VARPSAKTLAEPFTPIESDADWHEQGWAAEPEPLTVASELGMRISIDLNAEDAALVRRAARLLGLTRAGFVRQAAISAAAEALHQSEQ
jgi:hypothetical protein